MKVNAEISALLSERFGRDTLIALATLDGGSPAVRTVNAYYDDGAFYIITHAQSGKVQQIIAHPAVAICGDWFTARGTGVNMGHIRHPSNIAVADTLRSAFASWYSNGHINEDDPNTIILRIDLTDGCLFSHGTRYDIEFR